MALLHKRDVCSWKTGQERSEAALQFDLIAGAPADFGRGRPATCSDLSGEHTSGMLEW